MTKFLSLLFLAFMALSSTLLFVGAMGIWISTFWWDKRLALLHRFSCFWASLYSWIMPAWPLTIEGRENIRKDAVYVMVSNHQSLLDILMYFRLFAHFKWVSKAEIFKIPLVGWNMYLNGYIGIRRGDKRSGVQMMETCRKTLSQGSSVFMFPEGTRSHDGMVAPFKAGAFRIAQKAKVPILPMVISGTTHALPKKSLGFHGRHPIHIKVLPELPYETFAEKPLEELTREIHALIAGELQALESHARFRPIPNPTPEGPR